jgi:prolyl oligopeptidase
MIPEAGKWHYPPTKTVDVVDDFFGTAVADPYRWLEDADTAEVQVWTQAQSDFARAYLDKLAGRDVWTERLTELWNFPRYSAPNRYGKYLFFTKNDGLQNQPVLYVQPDGEAARVLLDPNTLSSDGTIALVDTVPSKDGTLLLYALSDGGSDWRTFKIRDVATGQDVPDVIENVKFSSASWLPDNSGFFYSTFPKAADDEGDNNQNVYHQLYFHQVGTPQHTDEMVYERPDIKGSIFGTWLSDDGKYLALYVGGDSVSNNRLYYHKLGGNEGFVPLFDALDAAYYYLESDDTTFYVQTTKDAPRTRIIAVDLQNPTKLRDLVPEGENTIAFASVVSQHVVVAYMQDAYHQIKIYDLHGNFVRDVPLPTIGSILGIASQPNDTDFFITFTSFLYPPTVLRYDFAADNLTPFFPSEAKFDPTQYLTEQVFYASKDGTRVPMFITRKKELALTGDNPAILYGYGGYNISLTPTYINWLPAFLERGGVYVIANLRGGGEYGEDWHLAGTLERKQNTFDDFIAAGEWLIAHGYTSSAKLAIEGGSNGGLLVAACMLQRPDLFGAILCHVPVIDMLRFQHFTAGRYWTPEYGDANSSQAHFEFQYAYSPLHNIHSQKPYPPLLIMTADHDDRVVPMHSKKFAVALQAANPDNLTLLRIDIRAGHGFGKPTAQLIQQRVDVLAFLWAVFELKV